MKMTQNLGYELLTLFIFLRKVFHRFEMAEKGG